MPRLVWTGKEAVENHHKDVPFHLLEEVPELSFGDKDSGNLLVQGDNLVALKSLLPYYAGKVKCIYIDPPYNTGNENWVYNDNVNDPQIKEWLGQVVGKESEDLSRHDKWLCMMYPRLKLLRQLLREDGAIFISIDDNEHSNLKLICDEIFGKNNFVATIPWRKRTAKSDVPFGFSQDFESILCYAKSIRFEAAIDGGTKKYYETSDFPNNPWRIHDLTKQTTAEERPKSFFTIENPSNGKKYPANPLRTWAITHETFPKYYAEKRIVFPGDYDFLKIKNPVLRYFKADDMAKAGDKFGLVSASTYIQNEVGMTQDGTKEITEIFGGKKFNFPKPTNLISYFIKCTTSLDKNAIILDSFAGSGTTAHAVLKLNKQDGGNRKFIMIEMMDYANEITAERVRRVIKGYGDKEETGGGFRYYRLGKPLFDQTGKVYAGVTFSQLARHVFFTETGKPLEKKHCDSPLIGTYNNTAVYLLFNGILKDKRPDSGNVLTSKVYEILPEHEGPKVIYGTACRLSSVKLRELNITFKQIPYDIKAD